MQRLMEQYGANLPPAGANGIIMFMWQPQEMACRRHNHQASNGERGYIFRLSPNNVSDSYTGELVVHESTGEKRLQLTNTAAGTFNPHDDHERVQGAVASDTFTVTVYTEKAKAANQQCEDWETAEPRTFCNEHREQKMPTTAPPLHKQKSSLKPESSQTSDTPADSAVMDPAGTEISVPTHACKSSNRRYTWRRCCPREP